MKIMDDSMKVIIKKLDEIDNRLRSIEGGKVVAAPSSGAVEQKTPKIERDPLFSKALEVMDKLDEMSSKQLSESLKIDSKRADLILDQMEAAGLGTCYMKEA